MKEEVQVRGELIEHQHDALMAFHSRYSRNFVSKLLMRLAENMIGEYPPNLANFLIDEPMQGATRRKISVRLDREKHPDMWEFYESLPHGGKAAVLMNVLNGFVQAAEADRGLMEKAFWGVKPKPRLPSHTDEMTHPQEASTEQAPSPVGTVDIPNETAESDFSQKDAFPKGEAHPEVADFQEEMEQEPRDPMMDVVISL